MMATIKDRIFQRKSASRERGHFWQEIATNQIIVQIILRTFRDWFMTNMSKYND